MILKGPNFGGPMDQSFVDRCYILGGALIVDVLVLGLDSSSMMGWLGVVNRVVSTHLFFMGCFRGVGSVFISHFTAVFLEYFSPLRTS